MPCGNAQPLQLSGLVCLPCRGCTEGESATRSTSHPAAALAASTSLLMLRTERSLWPLGAVGRACRWMGSRCALPTVERRVWLHRPVRSCSLCNIPGH